MTEDRKHAILFATTLLCARKIIDLIDTDATERMGKKHWLSVFEKEAVDQVVQALRGSTHDIFLLSLCGKSTTLRPTRWGPTDRASTPVPLQ